MSHEDAILLLENQLVLEKHLLKATPPSRPRIRNHHISRITVINRALSAHRNARD